MLGGALLPIDELSINAVANKLPQQDLDKIINYEYSDFYF